jgi:NADP-dependent 3-hydroxy acid dehydrogenase YdfG
MPAFMAMITAMEQGDLPAESLDPERMDYVSLAPDHIADAVIHAINQPLGVSIGEMTVRAAGDHFIL